MYDVVTRGLQEELLNKENLLTDIFNKYVCAQKELSERLLEAGELVDLVRENAERYESLTNNLSCSCAHTPSPSPPEFQPVTSMPVIAQTVKCSVSIKKDKTFIFTDQLGSGFGTLLQNSMSHSVTNYCYHHLHYNEIVKKVVSKYIDNKSFVVLLLGNSTGVKKKDIVGSIDTLLKLNIRKLMLCAFPYSDSLSEYENNCIYKLNNLIYMLTCSHSDKLIYFDTNKFISGFKLTQEAMFFPKKMKELIATLIAYNINTVIANDITKCSLNDVHVLSSYTNSTVIDCFKSSDCTKEVDHFNSITSVATTSKSEYSHLGIKNTDSIYLPMKNSIVVANSPDYYNLN